MWRRLLTAAVVAPALLAAIDDDAFAQVACGKHGDVLAMLAERYGETPQVLAITDQGALLEVLVSQTGSWTIVLTRPGGLTCVVSTGQDWQVHPAAAVDPAV
jgi:hypothetical protein